MSRWLMVLVLILGGCILTGCAQNTDFFQRQTPTTPISVIIHNGPEMGEGGGYIVDGSGVSTTQPFSSEDITDDDGSQIVTLPPGTRNQVVKIWIDNGVSTSADGATSSTQDIEATVQATVQFLISTGLISQPQFTPANAQAGPADAQAAPQDVTPSVVVNVNPPATQPADPEPDG